MNLYLTVIMLKINWSVWVPISVSIASFISTIIMNIYNRKSIRKENKEMFNLNIENEKRNQRLKSYEEALSLLELPSIKSSERFNVKKTIDINDDFEHRVKEVFIKDLLLLDENEEAELQKKYSKNISYRHLGLDLRNIAVRKKKELLREEKKAVKK